VKGRSAFEGVSLGFVEAREGRRGEDFLQRRREEGGSASVLRERRESK
jgi:hypothetical protein